MTVATTTIRGRIQDELDDTSQNTWSNDEVDQYIADGILDLSPWLGVETTDSSLTTSATTQEYDVSGFDPAINSLFLVQVDQTGSGDYVDIEGPRLFADTLYFENRFSVAGRTLKVFYLGAFSETGGNLDIPTEAENLLVAWSKRKAYQKLYAKRANQSVDDTDIRPSDVTMMIRELSKEIEQRKTEIYNQRLP